MSLRVRLIVAIALMLLASLALGSALAWLHAVRSVATEMDAALSVGEHTVGTLMSYIDGTPDDEAQLRQIVRAFDGNRHLRAVLIGKDGAALASSSLASPPKRVPRWFAHMIGGHAPAMKLDLPSNPVAAAVQLKTDPANELTEVWTEFCDDLQVLLLFGLITFSLIYWILGRALRPLGRMSEAFTDIGPDVAVGPLPEEGPPELSRLARGFNAMVDRLAWAESKNRRLAEQLSTIQEEERAEIARDLHDEIGPYLFAMGVDASAATKLAETRGQGDIADHLQSIRDGVVHVQQQVKAILGRLRSGTLAEFGLTQALENLTSFWRSRRRGVKITVETAGFEKGVGEACDGVVYRIVQESLSNAMRHGKPHSVEIEIDASSGHEVVVQVTDDGGGLKASPETRGFGLRGMVERVTALGGDLDIRPRTDRSGVIVTARLPFPETDTDVVAAA